MECFMCQQPARAVEDTAQGTAYCSCECQKLAIGGYFKAPTETNTLALRPNLTTIQDVVLLGEGTYGVVLGIIINYRSKKPKYPGYVREPLAGTYLSFAVKLPFNVGNRSVTDFYAELTKEKERSEDLSKLVLNHTSPHFPVVYTLELVSKNPTIMAHLKNWLDKQNAQKWDKAKEWFGIKPMINVGLLVFMERLIPFKDVSTLKQLIRVPPYNASGVRRLNRAKGGQELVLGQEIKDVLKRTSQDRSESLQWLQDSAWVGWTHALKITKLAILFELMHAIQTLHTEKDAPFHVDLKWDNVAIAPRIVKLDEEKKFRAISYGTQISIPYTHEAASTHISMTCVLLDWGSTISSEQPYWGPKNLYTTPAYAAPEYFMSSVYQASRQKWDVWQWGLMAWELLTGLSAYVFANALDLPARMKNVKYYKIVLGDRGFTKYAPVLIPTYVAFMTKLPNPNDFNSTFRGMLEKTPGVPTTYMWTIARKMMEDTTRRWFSKTLPERSTSGSPAQMVLEAMAVPADVVKLVTDCLQPFPQDRPDSINVLDDFVFSTAFPYNKDPETYDFPSISMDLV